MASMAENALQTLPQALDRKDENGKDRLSLLPAELVQTIFCHLPSFSCVLSLAATCRRLQSVWATNINRIYHDLALIPGDRYARKLLAAQSGLEADAPLCAPDVVRLIRNSNIVERAIFQFEREIACHVITGVEDELIPSYGPGIMRHPPKLTPSERRRFIRYYYEVWTLMSLDSNEWPLLLEGMTLKRLYLLQEMCEVPSGDSKAPMILRLRTLLSPEEESEAYRRESLKWCIASRLQDFCKRLHGTNQYCPENHAKGEGGYHKILVIWDHFQLCLKEIVCGTTELRPDRPALPKSGRKSQSYDKIDQWEDSSGEE